MSKRYSTPTTSADGGAIVVTPAGVAHVGKCLGLIVENSSANTIYVQLFDGNAAPTAGAVPVLELAVPAKAQQTLDLSDVKTFEFTSGLVVAASSAQWQFTSVASCMFLTVWYDLLQ